MLGEGMRVQVRPGAGSLTGKTGIIVGLPLSVSRYDWVVKLNGDRFGATPVPFAERELIELGGKHAGLPHPENGPHERHGCLKSWAVNTEIYEAADHGRHADGQPRLDEERDAYYAGI